MSSQPFSIKYNMTQDTSCPRHYKDHFVSISDMKWQICCATPIRPIIPGEDWSTGSVMQERLTAVANGQRHPDCAKCWQMEDRGQKSWRQMEATAPLQQAPRLEIDLGNTCDMACRYCGPKDSSVWAARLAKTTQSQPQYTKSNLTACQLTDLYNQQSDWFDKWLKEKLPIFTNGNGLSFIGGEPLIMDKFYEILERLNLSNTTIQICTNLNTPKSYMDRFIDLQEKLIANGNDVLVRCSLDGIGAQQEWQRHGCNWDTITSNYFRLGTTNVRLITALTVTPLTLESMVQLGKFIFNSRNRICVEPSWASCTIVTAPSEYDPFEWFGCFHEEITEMMAIVSSMRHHPALIEHMNGWLTKSSTNYPSAETRLALKLKLDRHEKLWGGGSWRTVYPKIAAIVDSH